MQHKSYSFIAYMYAHSRIGRRELGLYQQAGWLTKKETEEIVNKEKEAVNEKYA